MKSVLSTIKFVFLFLFDHAYRRAEIEAMIAAVPDDDTKRRQRLID